MTRGEAARGAGAPLVEVVRGDTVESTHHGAIAVVDEAGGLVASAGDVARPFYPRSAVKPFQALAVCELLSEGVELDSRALAIATASHAGSEEQQIEVARLLALADADESVLGCPPALPLVTPPGHTVPEPDRLAHNCSGKHAAFVLAQRQRGGPPADYLAPTSTIQQAVVAALESWTGERPQGPSVDGCGAPAWRLSLTGLAAAMARLAAARAGAAARLSAAMRVYPELVGGSSADDTRLMLGDGRVVAKRGAEGVLAIGVEGSRRAYGVIVKVGDGASRATVPAIAPTLRALGVRVDDMLAAPAVFGGVRPVGALRAADASLAVAVAAQRAA